MRRAARGGEGTLEANPAARAAASITARVLRGPNPRTTREPRARGAKACRVWDRTPGRSPPRPLSRARTRGGRRTRTRWRLPRRRIRPCTRGETTVRGLRAGATRAGSGATRSSRAALPPRRRRPSIRGSTAARRTPGRAGSLGRRPCLEVTARLTSPPRRRPKRARRGRLGRRAVRSTSGSRVASSRIRRSGFASRLATPRATPARLSFPSTRTRTARTRWRARWWRSFSSPRATFGPS